MTTAPEITARCRDRLVDPLPWWRLHEAAMDAIADDCVQRHLMSYPEFSALACDTRVQKWTATSATGRPLGLGMMTDRLETVSLIEPRYFAKRFPDEHASGRVFYVLFVCAAPGAPRGMLANLIVPMCRHIVDHDGVAVMDFASARSVVDRASELVIGRAFPGMRRVLLDAQSYVAHTFA